MNSDTKRKKPQQKNQNIQVFVRVRPLNAAEKQGKSYSIVDCTGTRDISVRERLGDKFNSKTFAFDKVFGPDSKQADVYKAVLNPLIDEVLAGYNCTIFAYGQTGTGKTFTMEGERTEDTNLPWSDDPKMGLIPRALSHLFDELRINQSEFTVRVSYLELYNEELIDLLSPNSDNAKLRLFEDPSRKGTILVHGLEEIIVHSKNEVFSILEKGSLKRQTASTQMNEHSSRSHTIFSITVHIKENSLDGEELLKTGKLNLVDLAGSENIGRSGAVEKRAREAGNINQSLLTLGRVITSLVEKTPHIPYRESKLTRLLQESLGGRTKTSIIATISPAVCNVEETLSTLEYAHRAKNITNKPEINQKLTKKTLLKEYTEEIERLRRDLLASRDKNGIYLAEENYNQMINQLEQQNVEITQKIATMKALNEELEKKEQICVSLDMNLHIATDKLKRTREELHITKQDRNEKAHLLDKHVVTEKVLSNQAYTLLNVADESSTDTYLLHDKLNRKMTVEKMNREIGQRFRNSFAEKCTRISEGINNKLQDYRNYASEDKTMIGEYSETVVARFSLLKEMMSSLVKDLCDTISVLQESLKNQHASSLKHVEKQVDYCHTTTEDVTENLVTFKTVTFVEAFQKIVNNCEQQKAVSEELEHFIKHFKEDSEIMKRRLHDTLQEIQYLKEEYQKSAEKDLGEKKRFEQYIQTLEEQREKETEETSTYIQQIATLLKQGSDCIEKLSVVKCDHAKVIDDTTRTVQNMLSDNIELTTEITGSFHQKLNVCENDCLDISKNYENHVHRIIESLQQSSAKVSEHRAHVEGNSEFLKKKVLNIIETEEENWSKFNSQFKQQCLEHIEHQNSGLETHLRHTDTLTSHVQQAAVEQESVFETGKEKNAIFIHKALGNVENKCLFLEEWSNNLCSEVSQREAEVEKLLFEDLKKDIPTGSTPQRKDFTYPRNLAATSPHDEILERFRVTSANLSDYSSSSLKSDPDEINTGSPSTLSSSSTSEESLSSPESVISHTENRDDFPLSPTSSTVSNKELSTNLEAPHINLPKSSSEPQLTTENKENRKKVARAPMGKKPVDNKFIVDKSSKKILKPQN